MRVGEKEGKDREGGEVEWRIWSLGRRLELGADGKSGSGWARRSGGRGRREGVDGGTDYPKLEDLLPMIKDVFFIQHTYPYTFIRTGNLIE